VDDRQRGKDGSGWGDSGGGGGGTRVSPIDFFGVGIGILLHLLHNDNLCIISRGKPRKRTGGPPQFQRVSVMRRDFSYAQNLHIINPPPPHLSRDSSRPLMSRLGWYCHGWRYMKAVEEPNKGGAGIWYNEQKVEYRDYCEQG